MGVFTLLYCKKSIVETSVDEEDLEVGRSTTVWNREIGARTA
jgi:hypothetical protein